MFFFFHFLSFPYIYWQWKAFTGSLGEKRSPYSIRVGKADTPVRQNFHVSHDPPIQLISNAKQIILCSLLVILRSYPWHSKSSKDLWLLSLLFPCSLKDEQNLDAPHIQNIPLLFFVLTWATYSFKRKVSVAFPQQCFVNWDLHLCPFILLSKYFLENGNESNHWLLLHLFTVSIALEMSGSNYSEKLLSQDWTWRVLNVFKLVNNIQLKVRKDATMNEWTGKYTKNWGLQQ